MSSLDVDYEDFAQAMFQYVNPVCNVTAVWVLVYYLFMTLGPAAYVVFKDKTTDQHKEWAPRPFLNTLEQSPAFLWMMWAYAFTIDVDDASKLGWWYVGFLAIYPVVHMAFIDSSMHHTDKTMHPVVTISTMPRYGIVTYMAMAILAYWDEVDLKEELEDSLALGVLVGVGVFIGLFLTGNLLTKFFITPRFK